MLLGTEQNSGQEAPQSSVLTESVSGLLRLESLLALDSSKETLCIHQLFEAQAVAAPEAIALQCGTDTLTYEQLNQRANQLAHHLIGLGVSADSLVALSTPRSLEMVIAILGVLKAGAAYVPVDPAYPESRRSYLLQDALNNSTTPLLLTCSSLFELLSAEVSSESFSAASSSAASASPTILQLDTDWPTIAQQPIENPGVAMTADNLAYVIYTSGSTGNPKGVMVKHQGVVNHAIAMANAFEMTSGDRMLQFSSMSFDIIVEELYPTLITGAALVLRPEEIATSLTAFLEFTAAEKITILDLPTAFWHELVGGLARIGKPSEGSAAKTALADTIRLVIVGGEKASRAIYAQWFDLVGEYPRWLNTYGPTEATVTTTLYDPVAEGFDHDRELPIGRGIANAKTYVLNQAMEQVSPGDSGELYIGGPGLARGYLNLPEKTASAFVHHPFEEGARLYKTGDIVRALPDGNLEFVGRADFQVKIRGFRIELGEIESCLEKHPDVAQQIVLAREDVPGQKRLVAYVVAQDEREIDIPALQAFMGETLPTYMVPSAVVTLPALPMTTNGKVDRKALPAPTAEERESVVLPTTPLETQLAEMFETVLGVQPVGTTDNFFELGGHSLLVMRLLNEIETTFHKSLPVTTIFESPTVAQLAPVVEAQLAAKTDGSVDPGASGASECIVLLKSGTEGSPLFFVHDADGITSPYVNLAAQLPGDRAVYGIRPLSEPGIPMVHSRLPAMAAHYIKEIRRIQPKGPYLLGGLCAGGVIAFEMALQLEAAGESVALTALLDAPDVSLDETMVFAQQRLQQLQDTLPSGKLALVNTLLKKVVSKSRYEARTRLQQLKSTVQLQAFRYWQDRRDRGWVLPKSLYGLDVRSLYLFAEESYEPSALLKGNVVLIKAAGPGVDDVDEPYGEIFEDPLLGWGCRTQQPIATYDVPGGHSTMLGANKVHGVIGVLVPQIEQGLAAAESS